MLQLTSTEWNEKHLRKHIKNKIGRGKLLSQQLSKLLTL
jgi:hypothetical protein